VRRVSDREAGLLLSSILGTSWSFRVILLSFLTLAISGLVQPRTAAAVHSIPSPYRYFWDCNDDGYPDDGCARFRLGGIGWTSDKVDRVNAAFYQWRQWTHYDPYTDQNVTGDIFIDRDVSHPRRGLWLKGFSGLAGAPWPLGDHLQDKDVAPRSVSPVLPAARG